MVNVLAEQTREAQLEHIKALAARERSVAEFFTALTDIAQLCAPLVKVAIAQSRTSKLTGAR